MYSSTFPSGCPGTRSVNVTGWQDPISPVSGVPVYFLYRAVQRYTQNKIIEVDKLLRSSSHLKNVIRECHPEIAFWALAGKKPMNHVKRSTAGIAERLAHLKAFFPASDEVYQDALNRFTRKDLAHDDIIDAIGLAVTAAYAKEIISIPVIPELDEYELPMEIVYGDFTADE